MATIKMQSLDEWIIQEQKAIQQAEMEIVKLVAQDLEAKMPSQNLTPEAVASWMEEIEATAELLDLSHLTIEIVLQSATEVLRTELQCFLDQHEHVSLLEVKAHLVQKISSAQDASKTNCKVDGISATMPATTVAETLTETVTENLENANCHMICRCPDDLTAPADQIIAYQDYISSNGIGNYFQRIVEGFTVETYDTEIENCDNRNSVMKEFLNFDKQVVNLKERRMGQRNPFVRLNRLKDWDKAPGHNGAAVVNPKLNELDVTQAVESLKHNT